MSKVRWIAAALAAVPFAATFASTEIEAAGEHTVSVTINKVKALDKADVYSKGDFYARITIDGDIQKTEPVKQDAEITPNWKVSKKVRPGTVKVKVEILDKDVSQDDPIDINKVNAKRDLDFTVNTRSCKVEGFSSTYKCGRTISRAGKEPKSADVSFTVSVKK